MLRVLVVLVGREKFLFGKAKMNHISLLMGGSGGSVLVYIYIFVKTNIVVRIDIFINCCYLCQGLIFLSTIY